MTGVGGDVLFVEAASMPGKDGLVLTGQLGDVMKESARIALTYVKSHAPELGIDEHALDGREVHVHVPAGAIPKDGPSAGITMVTAIASLLTRRPVKSTIGMTGEVTLQGRVLPIGGLKQKVLAAHAAGLTEVIVPERNQPDLDDVPAEVREPDALPRRGARWIRCSRSRSNRRHSRWLHSGSAMPGRHEPYGSFSSGRGGELSDERSRAERCGEAPVMRCGAQRPHMHVEFVGQNLKRNQIMQWPLRVQ